VKLALIGATGFVGRRVCDEALTRGHEVTAVVRDATRVPAHPALRVATADVQDAEQVAAAVAGHDAVISCFHPGGHNVGTNPLVYRDIVEGTRKILLGVKGAGVSRIVYVGGCGSLYVRPGVMLIDDLEFIARHSKNGRPDGTYPPPEGPLAFDIPLGARMA
jgi:putative NADH-flavin reductase